MEQLLIALVSGGGLGFLNAYIAQETDLLSFGKYNHHEYTAWVAIFGTINFMLIKQVTNVVGVIGVTLISLVLSVIIPVAVRFLINTWRKWSNLAPGTHLPVMNGFFQQANWDEHSQLYTFDFDGNFISAGRIVQFPEERQVNYSTVTLPLDNPENVESYRAFVDSMIPLAREGEIIISEYTDYERKLHVLMVNHINLDV